MHRAFRIISVITLSAFLAGCDSEGEAKKAAPTSPEVAKEAAVKMPPPPGAKAPTK